MLGLDVAREPMLRRVSVSGLDLPVKLRRGLGRGKVVPAEELAQRLAEHDEDGDDALTRDDLARFLVQNHCGGPWFCQALAKTIFSLAEERWSRDLDTLPCETLGRVLHYAMSRPHRALRRYVLTPEAVMGFEPKVDLEGNSVLSPPPADGVVPKRPMPSAPSVVDRPSRGVAPRRRRPPRSRPSPRRPGPRPRK